MANPQLAHLLVDCRVTTWKTSRKRVGQPIPTRSACCAFRWTSCFLTQPSTHLPWWGVSRSSKSVSQPRPNMLLAQSFNRRLTRTHIQRPHAPLTTADLKLGQSLLNTLAQLQHPPRAPKAFATNLNQPCALLRSIGPKLSQPNCPRLMSTRRRQPTTRLSQHLHLSQSPGISNRCRWVDRMASMQRASGWTSTTMQRCSKRHPRLLKEPRRLRPERTHQRPRRLRQSFPSHPNLRQPRHPNRR